MSQEIPQIPPEYADLLDEYVQAARRIALRVAEDTLQEAEDLERKFRHLDPFRTFLDGEIGHMLESISAIPPVSHANAVSFRFVSNRIIGNGTLVYILSYTDKQTDEPWRFENGLYKPVIVEADTDSGINVANYLAQTRIRIPPDARGGDMLRNYIADWAARAAPHHAEEIDKRTERLKNPAQSRLLMPYLRR